MECAIVLFMTKTTPHNDIYAEDIFKLNVNFEKDDLIINSSVPPSFIQEIKKIVQKDIKIIYSEGEELICPYCNKILSKNGYHHRLLNKFQPIELQKYKCTKKEGCGYEKITNIDAHVPKGCNYENTIRYDPIKQYEIAYKSLDKMTESIMLRYHVKPTRQTMLNYLDNEGERYIEEKSAEFLKYNDDELSGVFAIDEQFPFVDGEPMARPVIMDVGTNTILNEINIPIEELNIEFKEKFLKDSLKGITVKGIVSDGDKAFGTIIDEIGVPHQRCVFHIMQNLMNELIKPINKLKRKIKTTGEVIEKIKEKLPFFKSKKVCKKNEKKIKELRQDKRECEKELKELENLKERISNIFKQKDPKKAHRRFKMLYNNLKNLPSVISSFIQRLDKYFDKAINFMVNDFLPPTNNQLECYNGVSLPDNQKRIYRTDRGLDRATKLGQIRWTERNRKIPTTN